MSPWNLATNAGDIPVSCRVVVKVELRPVESSSDRDAVASTLR